MDCFGVLMSLDEAANKNILILNLLVDNYQIINMYIIYHVPIKYHQLYALILSIYIIYHESIKYY